MIPQQADAPDAEPAWRRDELAQRLARANLEVIWDERDFDGDEWIELLAKKR